MSVTLSPTLDFQNAGYTSTAKLINISNDGVEIFAPEKIALVSAGERYWKTGEQCLVGMRVVSCKHLFTETMAKTRKMVNDEAVTEDIHLYLYANDTNEQAAIAYLKENFQRLAVERINALKKLAEAQETALGNMGL